MTKFKLPSMLYIKKVFNQKIIFSIGLMIFLFIADSYADETCSLRVPVGQKGILERVNEASKGASSNSLDNIYLRMQEKLKQGIGYSKMGEEWSELQRICVNIMSYRIVGRDYTEIEDWGAELWKKIFTSIESFVEGKGSFSSWVRGIENHLFADIFRGENSESKALEVFSDYERVLRVSPGAKDITQLVEVEEYLNSIKNDDHRWIVGLWLEGYTYSEISQQTGFPYEKVRSLMRRLTEKEEHLRGVDFPETKKVLSIQQSRKLADEIKDKISYPDHARILALWTKGLTQSSIASELGFTKGKVRDVIGRLRGKSLSPLVTKEVMTTKELEKQKLRELAGEMKDEVVNPDYAQILKLWAKGYTTENIVELGFSEGRVRTVISRLKGTHFSHPLVTKEAMENAMENKALKIQEERELAGRRYPDVINPLHRNILKLYSEGWGRTEIANKVRCSKSVVSGVLSRLRGKWRPLVTRPGRSSL